MNSILITGGSGFLGRALLRRLLATTKARVRVYSRGEHLQAQMAKDHQDARLGFFVGDVRDLGRLERAMAGCDAVIHAAALKRIEVGHYNPDEMVKTNINGTLNVIEAARRAHVERVVLVSSDKAYQPVSPYGLSKAMAEHLVLAGNRQNLGPNFRVVRYGNVAGSTGSVIPVWRALLEANPKAAVPVTDPYCTRFWMRLDQAVDLVLQALEADKLEGPLIPDLPAYEVQDLAAAMGAEGFMVKGLPEWEKMHEQMDTRRSSHMARRMSVEELRAELDRLKEEG